MQCLQAKQIIRIASDGGAIPGRASYGWIIQIGATPIVKGKGPAHGDDPRSFRAEGYGMASALVYLRLLQQHLEFHRERRTANYLICDNEGLLTRIEEAASWQYTTPNVTLRSEWDIESVILDTYKALNIHFVFVHVKSHQDDDTPAANLSLASRLNVKADRLATEYMKEDPIRRPIAALFPSAKAQLIIQSASVTRKIPQSIQMEAGSKGIREYLLERNNWTNSTFDDINWDAHGASHAHHRPYQCFLVKLCHRHLPLGETLHRRDTKYPILCPGCRTEPESQNHFLQCAAPSRIAWRIKLLTRLKQQMKQMKTNEQFQATIIECLDKTLSDRDQSTTGPFRSALEAQQRIGWLRMIKGHWSNEWQKAYDNTYTEPTEETRKEKNTRKRSMDRWQKKIIQTIWGSMVQLWTTRNAERHGWDQDSQDSSRREVLHEELEDIYLRKHEYPERVQRLLRNSYEEHIQETVTKLADWMDAFQGTFAMTWSLD
jgi:hypothetical protein